MAQERVSNTQVIGNTLKVVLTHSCSKLIKVSSVELDCPMHVPSGHMSGGLGGWQGVTGEEQFLVAAGAVAALHPAPHSCLCQVDDLVQIIYRQLMLVTRRSLRDILMQTLLQLAQLQSWDVTTSLLRISITGDIDMALQLQENPRTSENCPDKTCYGQDGPTDSELCHHTTIEAMWNTLVCKPSISGRILKLLMKIQHGNMLLNNFGKKCNCHLLLTVSVQMRPGLPCLGLHTPLQLPLHLLPNLDLQKVTGVFRATARQSSTCCSALRQTGRQPAPAALGGPPPSPSPAIWAARKPEGQSRLWGWRR